MRPSSRLVCSDRPEGRVLSCLYPPATQPFPRFMFEGRAYQYKVLPFGLSRLPHVFTKVMEVALVPLRERGMRVLNDWLILAQGPGAQAPQPVGFGSTGKRAIFSRHGVGFGQPDSTPHPGSCSIGAELPQDFIRQDGGPTETFSEAPGAHGFSYGNSSARSAPYECSASALAPWPSPEVGEETRYSPGSEYTSLPHNLHPVDRSLVSSGRSAPGAGIQAFCGIHGCLSHQLGSHVQWACSVRGMDRSPTASAYQLPRVAGSTYCPETPSGASPTVWVSLGTAVVDLLCVEPGPIVCLI